jgi:delta24(24(1))-sterol reductase
LKQFETLGYIHNSMYFMLTAHGLYTNAIMKGEECICTTWDIFYEKWGWMLIYWNLAGVPFVYCIQSYYILMNHPLLNIPTFFYYFLYATLFVAYYVWDASQRQRNSFRMMRSGTFKPRFTFPQLPGGILEHPRFLKTAAGSELLIDGFWQYARKPHYTADIYMALSWGLVCGFGSLVPYFYFMFFTGMIIHRALRDIDRCEKKYGNDWKIYCKKVPYLFIPGVY